MNTLNKKMSQGFSVIEILVVVAIVLALSAVSLLSLSAMRDRLMLNDARSSLAFHLEESKAKAVAGTGGEPHGIYFTDDSYVQFTGSEYDPEDASNIEHTLRPGLTLSTDILSADKVIIFSRIIGSVGNSVTLTISLDHDEDEMRTIVVGPGGDLSYEE